VFVLGIDPGLSRCGYACIERGPGRRVAARAMGVLTTPPQSPLPARLAELRGELVALLDELSPDIVVVEHVFFQTNRRTAMSVAQASGLALAEASARGCEVVQYTANQVKHTLTGFGAASKAQIGRMVQVQLRLAAPPRPVDASDAAALALCHLATMPARARLAVPR
jgi:crossover junction endodeoxyribonuclease RuvC